MLFVLDPAPHAIDTAQRQALVALAAAASHAAQWRSRRTATPATPWCAGAALAAHAAAPCADGVAALDDHVAYALLRELRDNAQERAAEQQDLRDTQRWLERAGDVAGIGGWDLDLRTSRLRWSSQTRRIHEVDSTYVPTLDRAIAFYAPLSRAAIQEALDAGLRTGRPWDLELPLITRTGRPIWVRAVGEVEFEAGRPVRMRGACQDVTERKGLEQRVARLTATLHTVIESVPAQVSVVDRHGVVQFANSGFERWAGWNLGQLAGQPLAEALGPAGLARCRPWIDRAAAGETVSVEEDRPGPREGARWAVTYAPLWSEHGQTDGFVQVAHHIVHHRVPQGPLRPAAHRDATTGLLDRVGFVGYLERQVAQGAGATLAMLCVDLELPVPRDAQDGAAPHAHLLDLFARRLGGLVRPVDAVARLGDRQFAVVLVGIADPQDARTVADKIGAMAAEPFELGDGLVRIHARVGMAWGMPPGQSWPALLARADAQVFQPGGAGPLDDPPGCPEQR